MKLCNFELNNNEIFGDFALDFTDGEGNFFDTIVLAGENGTGKTKILEQLYYLSTGESLLLGVNEIRKGKVFFSQSEIEGINRLNNSFNPEEHLSEISMHRVQENSYDPRIKYGETNFSINWGGIWKSLYLDTQINFKTIDINSISNMDVDLELRSERTDEHSFNRIKQLLVDIFTQDKVDIGTYVSEHGEAPPEDQRNLRLKRFQEAFSYFFPTKKFKDVKRNPEKNRLEIVFSEGNKEIPIEALSSGEKQIVFRAGVILKSIGILKSSVVVVDEPEISLHPEWQKKIVGFYEKLLSSENGEQTSQLFIATHSPYIIQNSVGRKIIVLEKDNETAEITTPLQSTFPGVSETKIIEVAFNLKAIEQFTVKDFVLLVEGETDKKIIEAAWTKIFSDEDPFFDVLPVSDSPQIRVLLNREQIFHKFGGKTFIGMFDFDEAYNDWNGMKKKKDGNGENVWDFVEQDTKKGLLMKHKNLNGYSFLLPVPDDRSTFASKDLKHHSTLSIEFLFPDSAISSDYFSEKPLPQSTAVKKLFKDNKKVQFADEVVPTFTPGKFENFKPIFELLKKIKNSEY